MIRPLVETTQKRVQSLFLPRGPQTLFAPDRREPFATLHLLGDGGLE